MEVVCLLSASRLYVDAVVCLNQYLVLCLFVVDVFFLLFLFLLLLLLLRCVLNIPCVGNAGSFPWARKANSHGAVLRNLYRVSLW